VIEGEVKNLRVNGINVSKACLSNPTQSRHYVGKLEKSHVPTTKDLEEYFRKLGDALEVPKLKDIPCQLNHSQSKYLSDICSNFIAVLLRQSSENDYLKMMCRIIHSQSI
jgi:hypothetical protein